MTTAEAVAAVFLAVPKVSRPRTNQTSAPVSSTSSCHHAVSARTGTRHTTVVPAWCRLVCLGQPGVTGLARRVDTATDTLELLEALRGLRAAVVAREAEAVVAARSGGASWGEVGRRLGVSRQAAQQRHERQIGRAHV